MSRRWIVLFLILLIATPAFAWGPAGHKIIASIAFRQLSKGEQGRIVELLKDHPRYVEDFAEKMPADVKSGDDAARREWIFQQAAVWPDIAKSFKDAEREKYNYESWHYINNPIFLDETDKPPIPAQLRHSLTLDAPTQLQKNANVIQTLRVAKRAIADPALPADERAVILCWLLHCVGDIHQPLHSTTLLSRQLFPKGDRGGSQIATVQRSNLHSLWDGFPGGEIEFAESRNRAIEYANDPTLAKLRKNAEDSFDELDWMSESIKLSKTAVYSTEVRKALQQLEQIKADPKQNPLKLSEDYLKQGGEISRRRLVEAGVRLGVLLKTVADPKSKSQPLTQRKLSAPVIRSAPKSEPVARFWLNTSTDVRHNERCDSFNNTKKGRFCTSTEGKACGKCGG